MAATNSSQTTHQTGVQCKFGDVADLTFAHYMLATYNSLPAMVFGFPGNLLIILIATRKHNRSLSPSVYMTAMAVVDSILLTSSSVFFLLLYGTDLIHRYRDILYIGVLTVILMTGMMSGFYLSAMSVDRLLAIRYPMVAPRLCSPGQARKVVCIGTFLIFAANLHLLFVFRYVKYESGLENIIFHVPGDPAGPLLATAFQLIFGVILPFLIIIGSNIIIIVTVKAANKKRAQLQGQKVTTSERGSDEARYLMRMLISVSMAYVLTSSPYRLFQVILLIPEFQAVFDLSDPCYFILYNIIIASLYALWIWNFAINFYMYCLGGGKRYRNDIAEIFGKLKSICCCRKS